LVKSWTKSSVGGSAGNLRAESDWSSHCLMLFSSGDESLVSTDSFRHATDESVCNFV